MLVLTWELTISTLVTMPDRLTLHPTADGSVTLFSDRWQEAFHSVHGAKQEAEAKFVLPAGIIAKARTQDRIQILDICYGLGYNSAAALEALSVLDCEVEIIALESNLAVPQTAIAEDLVNIWSPDVSEILKTVAHSQVSNGNGVNIKLWIGDARETINNVAIAWADAIFLDPFSPPRCPQLWTVEFIQLLAQCLKPNGYMVTYSCAAAVRTALVQAGLNIGSTQPVGRRSPGTIAAFPPQPLPPISATEQEILQTRAAIPYRDRSLIGTPEAIITLRQHEQSVSVLEPASSWKKRCMLRDIET